jgi:periodic tryptophan protein 2
MTHGTGKEFAPFRLLRRYTGHHADVTCLDWSDDSRFFVTGSKDTTCRIYSVHPVRGYKPVALTAHRDRLVGVFFHEKSLDIYSVSHDGSCIRWRGEESESMLAILGGPRKAQRTSRSPSNDFDDADDADYVDDTDGMNGVGEVRRGTAGDEAVDGEADSGSGSESGYRANTELCPTYRWSLKKEDKHYFMQDHAKVLVAVYHKRSAVLVAGFSNGVFGL